MRWPTAVASWGWFTVLFIPLFLWGIQDVETAPAFPAMGRIPRMGPSYLGQLYVLNGPGCLDFSTFPAENPIRKVCLREKPGLVHPPNEFVLQIDNGFKTDTFEVLSYYGYSYLTLTVPSFGANVEPYVLLTRAAGAGTGGLHVVLDVYRASEGKGSNLILTQDLASYYAVTEMWWYKIATWPVEEGNSIYYGLEFSLFHDEPKGEYMENAKLIPDISIFCMVLKPEALEKKEGPCVSK